MKQEQWPNLNVEKHQGHVWHRGMLVKCKPSAIGRLCSVDMITGQTNIHLIESKASCINYDHLSDGKKTQIK